MNDSLVRLLGTLKTLLKTICNGLCISENDGLIFGWAYIWNALSVSNVRWAYAQEGHLSLIC